MAEKYQAGIGRGRGKIATAGAAQARPDEQVRNLCLMIKKIPLLPMNFCLKQAQRPTWTTEGGPRPQAPLTVQSAGRATTHRVPEQLPGFSAAPGANGESNRGNMRGRRTIGNFDVIRTRSDALQTKKGTTGRTIKLTANFFRLLKKPTWSLYQYHVDFSPEVDIIAVRKGLLRVHSAVLQGHIFDGSTLFLTNSLGNDVTELFSKNRLEENIRITVKFVGAVSMAEGRAVQILNIIMRKALEGLKLQLVGRNFFDPLAKIIIREHNLELWPGYLTSIRQHEQDVLLCSEITHKVMRTETIHDILRNITQRSRGANWHDEFIKTVVGMTVLTDYNNKFYRIDDVDFNKSPSSSFESKAGVSTTFIDYYKTKYNKNITDKGQPLLISNAKARDIRAGMADYIALVPELCRSTGLNDDMRNNFQLMRAMGDYTRVGPDVRIRKLLEFNRRLYNSPESLAVFTEWQMTLDKNLVEVTGRELANENILFSGGKKDVSDRNADWTCHFRGAYQLFNTTQLANWIVVQLERDAQAVRDFVGVMIDAARAMGFKIAQPK